jgi:hypothetical protein
MEARARPARKRATAAPCPRARRATVARPSVPPALRLRRARHRQQVEGGVELLLGELAALDEARGRRRRRAR